MPQPPNLLASTASPDDEDNVGVRAPPPHPSLKRRRSRTPASTSEYSSAGEETDDPGSRPESRKRTPSRQRSPRKRPRITPVVVEGHYLRNDASLAALSVLRAMPVEDRVAERYITAVHALDHLYRNRRPLPKQIDQLAHDLVINAAELRRVYTLSVFARIAEQHPRQIERFWLRHILAGHRNPQRNRREIVKTKPNADTTRKGRRWKSHPLKGASIREARDALASAAWEPLARSQQAYDLLNGDETVPSMREDGAYVDDTHLVPLDGEDARLEEEATQLESDEYLMALRELPDADRIPAEVLLAVAREVMGFARVLRETPHLGRPEDVFDSVQKSGRHENEQALSSIRMDGNLPSQSAYRMTLYRVESVAWQACPSTAWKVAEAQAQMQAELRERVLKRTNVHIHPFVECLMLRTFSSIDEFSEDGSQLTHFGELLGAQKRSRILHALQGVQVEALLSMMKVPDQQIAARLVGNFRSARRSMRASLSELLWLYRDGVEANRVIQHLHGHQSDYFPLLAPYVRLPHLVGRVLHSELGNVELARAASFSRIVGPCRRTENDEGLRRNGMTLTPDERLGAYSALHAERGEHDQTSWARFEASWGLFRLVCERTRVEDVVGVTGRLLDEQKEGAKVLGLLAKETVEDVCVKIGINADEAVRLKTFACCFVPSACS